MLICTWNCLLRSLTSNLGGFFNFLQMITVRIVKRSSVLKHPWVTSFAFTLRFGAYILSNFVEINLRIIFFHLICRILVFVHAVVRLESCNGTSTIRLLYYRLWSWMFSRILFLARFWRRYDDFRALWRPYFIWSFHFRLSNFSISARFGFLFWTLKFKFRILLTQQSLY